jgi:hypothetical protein
VRGGGVGVGVGVGVGLLPLLLLLLHLASQIYSRGALRVSLKLQAREAYGALTPDECQPIGQLKLCIRSGKNALTYTRDRDGCVQCRMPNSQPVPSALLLASARVRGKGV